MKSLLWCLVAAAAVAGLGDSAAALRGVDRSALSLVSQKLNWKTSIVNEHDKHILYANDEDLVLACVFNPPVTGREVHDADGSYPAAS